MVGEVAHALDGVDGVDEHRLHTVEHGLLAHRATVAAAAHREVRGALAVVADVGDESTVGSERRVDLGRHECVDLGGELVVGGESLDRGRHRLVRVTDDETLGAGVVERGAGEQRDVVTGDDHLHTIVRADLIGERCGQVFLERQVVAKLLTGVGSNGQT